MQLSIVFDKAGLEKEKLEIENELNKPEVYSDIHKSKTLNKKLSAINIKLEEANKLGTKLNDLSDFILLSESEDDESIITEIDKELKVLSKSTESFYTKTLLKGKYDSYSALVKIHSGAGGTEACDWVEMLYRMYNMYASRCGFKVNLLDAVDGDGAGFKSISLEIEGVNAYGYFKGEIGVHRLVRISPFDSNKRRHTSFASVEVLPEIEEDSSVTINQNDLRIDTYRASGAGGQHVNKTDSAVRITHIPTGIVVACQNERSQLQNKETAMKMLMSKLVSLKEEENKKNTNELKGDERKIEWGSQIRSYVFCPYKLVKDNRSNYETSNLDDVMNGNLDDFVFEYLKSI